MKIVSREEVYVDFVNEECEEKCDTFYVVGEIDVNIKDTEKKLELRCTCCGTEQTGDIDIWTYRMLFN